MPSQGSEADSLIQPGATDCWQFFSLSRWTQSFDSREQLL